MVPPYPGSTAVEGKKHIPKNWSLFGHHFSQGFATAVTFSYVYHFKLSLETNSTSPSLLPTIQIPPRGYQIFFFDCLQDVMLANNFFWTSGSLIGPWAFLLHHLFMCGLDPSRYKGHSFRIGAASYAADRGFSDAQIRMLGRWKSNAFLCYIRAPSLLS